MTRGCIFSCVWPFYERAVSDLDRSIHRSLWVLVTHSLFIEVSLMTKNTASGHVVHYSKKDKRECDGSFTTFNFRTFVQKVISHPNCDKNASTG